MLLGARHDGNPWTLALRGPLPANLRALTLHLGLPSPTLKAHVRLQWRDLERGGEWQGFEGPALPFLDPSPGLHRIEVRGLQPGGQASPVWAGSFLIQWPWWRRPWALLLWTLLLGTLIFAVHRLRLERIQHRNRELAALVAERTAALAVSEAREREASQAKSTFLANMSHELRTPLNAILLYAELIHGDAEEAGHADLSRDSGRILSSGRHLLSLINGILDLSKIEAGKMTLDLEDLSLPALLADVAHTLAPLAEQKGVALGVTIPDPDLHLRTDGLKLKQVLLNLVGNAVKFTERGSVELVALREEGGLRLEVRDTGIGLTPDQVARIFNAYEQADRTTVAKAGGTGLGLTISQKFVSLLGGRIEVESEPGRGATFRVLLPLVPPAPGPERPAPPG